MDKNTDDKRIFENFIKECKADNLYNFAMFLSLDTVGLYNYSFYKNKIEPFQKFVEVIEGKRELYNSIIERLKNSDWLKNSDCDNSINICFDEIFYFKDVLNECKPEILKPDNFNLDMLLDKSTLRLHLEYGDNLQYTNSYNFTGELSEIEKKYSDKIEAIEAIKNERDLTKEEADKIEAIKKERDKEKEDKIYEFIEKKEREKEVKIYIEKKKAKK